jgi:hypothetical protein
MPAGDTNLFFSRDTKVYAVQNTGTGTANAWLLPVLNGYSFSQSSNVSQVTVNEMASASNVSRRGQAAFTDSLAPAEWSFDLYARPTLASSLGRAPEELLWHSLFAETEFTQVAGTATGLPGTAALNAGIVTLTFTTAAPAGGTYFKVGDTIAVSGIGYTGGTPASGTNNFTVLSSSAAAVTYAAPTGTSALTTPTSAVAQSTTFSSTSTLLDFLPTSSNKTRLATFDLYFVVGASKASASAQTNHAFNDDEVTTIYKIANCCVNEATMNFDIDGIATISFSGMGTLISEITAFTFTGSNIVNPGNGTRTYTLNTAGATATNNMIRNRLTSATVVAAANQTGITAATPKTYGITLTGGSITISNNMTFLTPESIGVVNTPLGHVTGTRSVTGNFTCYMDEITNGSIDLYNDLLSATSLITNRFAIVLHVGGGTGGTPTAPGVAFDLGQCHLEIPTVNVDDVMGYEINFTALPTSISNTNELTRIRYAGVA